jgi:hypothetical protein
MEDNEWLIDLYFVHDSCCQLKELILPCAGDVAPEIRGQPVQFTDRIAVMSE